MNFIIVSRINILGLAIADAIAKTYVEDITVTSEVSVGSCFQVLLPLAS
ncbi:hypothetical protein [Nostoc sp. NMS8]|nr:hypothetical protein [Nostoc sp. NMS8]MBN3958017.1 hypothetical protein [Nostoc sp. NMS8]